MDVNGVRYSPRRSSRTAGVAGSLAGLLLRFSHSLPGSAGRSEALGVAFSSRHRRDVVRTRGWAAVLPLDVARLRVQPDLSDQPTQSPLHRRSVPRVEQWFASGLELLPLLDRRSRSCVAAMAGIYHRLLHLIERDPGAVLRGRLSLSTKEKLWVAARSLAGMKV